MTKKRQSRNLTRGTEGASIGYYEEVEAERIRQMKAHPGTQRTLSPIFRKVATKHGINAETVKQGYYAARKSLRAKDAGPAKVEPEQVPAGDLSFGAPDSVAFSAIVTECRGEALVVVISEGTIEGVPEVDRVICAGSDIVELSKVFSNFQHEHRRHLVGEDANSLMPLTGLGELPARICAIECEDEEVDGERRATFGWDDQPDKETFFIRQDVASLIFDVRAWARAVRERRGVRDVSTD